MTQPRHLKQAPRGAWRSLLALAHTAAVEATVSAAVTSLFTPSVGGAHDFASTWTVVTVTLLVAHLWGPRD